VRGHRFRVHLKRRQRDQGDLVRAGTAVGCVMPHNRPRPERSDLEIELMTFGLWAQRADHSATRAVENSGEQERHDLPHGRRRDPIPPLTATVPPRGRGVVALKRGRGNHQFCSVCGGVPTGTPTRGFPLGTRSRSCAVPLPRIVRRCVPLGVRWRATTLLHTELSARTRSRSYAVPRPRLVQAIRA